ncbi:hypothetical protein Tco_0540892 [Tanacetum coccineum]
MVAVLSVVPVLVVATEKKSPTLKTIISVVTACLGMIGITIFITIKQTYTKKTKTIAIVTVVAVLPVVPVSVVAAEKKSPTVKIII